MTGVSIHTDERIEPQPVGLKRTCIVVLTVGGVRFVTEVANAREGARVVVATSEALGIGRRGDVDAGEDVPA